jgi:hypothetical protein
VNPGIAHLRVALVPAVLISSVNAPAVAENEGNVSALDKGPCALALVRTKEQISGIWRLFGFKRSAERFRSQDLAGTARVGIHS